MDRYYIVLIGEGLEKEWKFTSNESMNRAFDAIVEKFSSKRNSEIPFIEVCKDISLDMVDKQPITIQIPFRLNPDSKDDVIKYISEIHEASQ